MVTYEDIVHAQELIAPHIIRTPLIYSPTFSGISGARVFLKLETLQKAGSFKVRGATNRILSAVEHIGDAGVVAASAGNHAQGVAVAARMAGVPATIVMPVHASLSKQAATRSYGANVILKGETLQESIEAARQLGQEGMEFIHPYDDPEIIAGQGTIGLEILEDLEQVDTVVVPVGGGGLISGIATAMKTRSPAVCVIGVQAAACPSASEARTEGRTVRVVPEPSVADGILVPVVGTETLPVIRSLVDEIVLVSEEEIIDAMLLLLERKKILAEGAGAVPLAALLNNHISVKEGSNVVLVISGGNVDTPLLAKVINRGLVRKGRIMHTSILLRDVPGSLAELITLIAKCNGNVIHIEHRKDDPRMPVSMAIVDLVVETSGPEHADEINRVIRDSGFRQL